MLEEQQIQGTRHKAQGNEGQKSLLRFLTCGSVDDGKSTLIGRLLFECDAVFDNELENLKRDSERFGNAGDKLDFSLLVDGLSSEREQGITIDVAYRYFSSKCRSFIVADTPGHEQYTRNMVTGASNCEAAIIMIDARLGLLPQTKRHSFIASQLGIKEVIIAVNKIDLLDYKESIFNQISLDYLDFAEKLSFEKITIIPVSALNGDNISSPSPQTPWYQGKSVLEALETLSVTEKVQQDFSFCVQWVNRPDDTFRGFSGTISSGEISKGDNVRLLPSNQLSTIKSISTFDGELKSAKKNEAVTITLEDECDLSRGDVICKKTSPLECANQFQTTLVWMSEAPMVNSRQYLIKLGTQSAIATISKLKHAIDINTLEEKAANKLCLNEFGVTELSINKPLAFKPYGENQVLGGFILIDRINFQTVACGFIDFALRRSGHVYKHHFQVGRSEREAIKDHKGTVIWLTGLSGAGKSTIANLVESKLNEGKIHTTILDGDNVRHGLNKDLGFSESDRAENIRRIAEVSKLMLNAGLITIVSFISPFKAERQMARELIGDENFLEVHVNVSTEAAEARDPKGLYKKARQGEIKNFTGIDSPYEEPEKAEIVIDTEEVSAEAAADLIITELKERGLF
jgi:bifunctional enzyme CysN/CysC